MLSLSSKISQIPFIGDAYAQKLAKLGVIYIKDLLHDYPRTHVDRSQITPISGLVPEEKFTLIGELLDFKNIYTRNRKQIQQAVISDSSGTIQATWFNQPFLSNSLIIGQKYSFTGKVKLFGKKLQLQSPVFEKIMDNGPQLHALRLVPIYNETKGVSSKWLRSRIKYVLTHSKIEDFVPDWVLSQQNLWDLEKALNQIHFPDTLDEFNIAKKRLAFDEVFLLQLAGAYKRAKSKTKTTDKVFTWPKKTIENFINKLPFDLTKSQRQSVDEILSDLGRSHPMNRLLEGDVGSGKTVVAAIAMLATHLSKYRSVLMAPTEILASQHYETLNKLFTPLGIEIGLITGQTKSNPDADILVGTHALLFQNKYFDNLGLIIIDEQHRFGVEQRAKLETIGDSPHRLTMSATPIPRTIALTLYGDLSVSIIDEMPKERTKVKTWIVPEEKRQKAYQWIKDQIKNGDQVFVVCPLIDASNSIALTGVRSAVEEYEYLSKIFKGYKIGLLHGRQKATEKAQVIESFSTGKLDLLISTQVIEVGINVPNATVMIIEAAERFGLAQLHQLRGRVGRGNKPGYCLLFSTNKTESRRLKALTKIHSGFELAKIDLSLRGPGEVFGIKQHGFDGLKLARLTDKKLLKATREYSEQIINLDQTLAKHPLLKKEISPLIDHTISEN